MPTTTDAHRHQGGPNHPVPVARRPSARAFDGPALDSAEVARRSGAMQAEIRPRTELGRYLVRRVAELTVRVERSSRHERAAIDHLTRHAGTAYVESRLAEVEKAGHWITVEPAASRRKLLAMPEGVNWMVDLLLSYQADLQGPGGGRWDAEYGHGVASIQGIRYLDAPVNRPRALTEAIAGNFALLSPGEAEGLDPKARRAWARDRMAELIDAEVDALRAHYETLDIGEIVEERDAAADRALADPPRSLVLARKHEAAAERAIYRALRALKEVEGIDPLGQAPDPSRAEAEVEAAAEESLGSSCTGRDPDEGQDPDGPEGSPDGLEFPPVREPEGEARKPVRGVIVWPVGWAADSGPG